MHEDADRFFGKFFDLGEIVPDVLDDMAQLFGQRVPVLLHSVECPFPLFNHCRQPFLSRSLVLSFSD